MAKKHKVRTGVTADEMGLAKQLTDLYMKALPSADAIIGEAHGMVRPSFADADDIKRRASDFITMLMQQATEVFHEYERQAMGEALSRTYMQFITDGTGTGVVEALRSYPKALDTFFLSVAQSRKSRAGSTFEKFILALLDELNYPYTYQPVVDGKPDFILPSIDRYRELAMDCIVLTAKTTLRERWRQITTEGSRGGVLYLATIDDKVKHNDLLDMARQKIYLVVPASVKEHNYATHGNVVSFETFLGNHLDPAVQRWG